MTGLRGARILITTDAVGGVWVYSITLARALARRGCDLVVLSLGPRPREDQLLPLRDVPNIEFATSDFALEWMDPEGHDFDRAREGLAGIARQVKPDIVHLNSYREALGDWHAPV